MKTKLSIFQLTILVILLITFGSCKMPRVGLIKSKEITEVDATGGF